MKSNIKFKKGEFITQNSYTDSFAIFDGCCDDDINGSDGSVYSLICYYNPRHYTQNSDNRWVTETIFEYNLDGSNTCEYTLEEEDFIYWRTCTQSEIDKALEFLAKKGLAWIDKENKFRKLGANEKLCFGNPVSTGACGGNVRYNGNPSNPFYKNTQQQTVKHNKQVTLFVKDAWEQKSPITGMNDERRNFVSVQCDKLKFAFNTYSSNGVMIYPNCGTQVPRRYDGYDDYHGHMNGIDAYNQLMRGTEWWGYDEME